MLTSTERQQRLQNTGAMKNVLLPDNLGRKDFLFQGMSFLRNRVCHGNDTTALSFKRHKNINHSYKVLLHRPQGNAKIMLREIIYFF